jgi:hypothetical protein
VPSFLQFLHNRDEEGYMWRIVEINPIPFIFGRAVPLVSIQNVAISVG